MNKYDLTKNIISELGLKVSLGKDMKKENSPLHGYNRSKYYKSNILVLFTGTDVGLYSSISEINKLKEKGFKVNTAISKEAERIIGVDTLRKELKPEKVYTDDNKLHYKDIIKESDGAVVLTTTQNTAIKLALGIQDEFIPTLLWQFLWDNKSVFMDMEAVVTKGGKRSENKYLCDMVERYIEKLEDMGVNRISKGSYISSITEVLRGNKTNYNYKRTYKEETYFKEKGEKQVITEGDILKFVGNKDRLIIPKGSIITHLARDTAREKGIEIIME